MAEAELAADSVVHPTFLEHWGPAAASRQLLRNGGGRAR
jgi:hypothetical protein